MGLNTFTAAILLVAGAIQADAFAMGPVRAGRTSVTMSSLSQVSAPSARGDVFKLNLSPYEEYMASRGGSVSTPETPSAPAPVSAPAASAPARSSKASSGSKWSPRPDWKSGSPNSSRGRVSSPTAARGSSPSAPSAPAVSAPSYSPPAPYSPPAAAAPAPAPAANKTGDKHIGTGGMADTRDPDPVNHADPRKSISAAPSFEEYLKSKKN